MSKSKYLTFEQAGERLALQPHQIGRLVTEGELPAVIDERALNAFVKRRIRLTRHYIQLRRTGMPARQAWAQALAEERKKRR